MAGRIQDDEDDVIGDINVTPLVDIALVLLIIFMVTTSFIVKQNIPIELPKAQTGETSENIMLAVAVTRGGDVYLNGNLSNLDAIPAVVASTREKGEKEGKSLAAFVSADKRAPYGVFARVVDRLRLAGVFEIAMDTKPEELEDPSP